VRLPGQAGLKLREQALRDGVSLSQKVLDELNKPAGQLQLPTLS
jgi:LDH2 family malate/lactate/ureidoglycolate dehydrogenase